MRIAVICPVLDPQEPGGAQAIALANHLAGRGHAVELYCGYAVDAVLDERVQCCRPGRLPRPRAMQMIAMRRWIMRRVTQSRPEFTIAFSTLTPGDVLIPVTSSVRSMLHEAAPRPRGPGTGLLGLVVRMHPLIAASLVCERKTLADPTVKTLIACSEQIARELETHHARDGLAVQRADVPLAEQQIDSVQAGEVRRRLARAWSICPDASWLVCSFRSANVGGLEPMVRAFQSLIDSGQDAVLLLAGPTRYTHLAWLAQLGLRDHVRFVGRTARLAELAAAADLVVQPTERDPAGWGIRPALQTATPIITTTACDLSGVVRQRGGTVLNSPVAPAQLLLALRERLQSLPESDGEAPETLRPTPDSGVPTLFEAVGTLIACRGSLAFPSHIP